MFFFSLLLILAMSYVSLKVRSGASSFGSTPGNRARRKSRTVFTPASCLVLLSLPCGCAVAPCWVEGFEVLFECVDVEGLGSSECPFFEAVLICCETSFICEVDPGIVSICAAAVIVNDSVCAAGTECFGATELTASVEGIKDVAASATVGVRFFSFAKKPHWEEYFVGEVEFVGVGDR